MVNNLDGMLPLVVYRRGGRCHCGGSQASVSMSAFRVARLCKDHWPLEIGVAHEEAFFVIIGRATIFIDLLSWLASSN